MSENRKLPNLVGQFIRQRREALGLSQRALGALFTPAVTTQFISNVERGVTPLPPTHVEILTRALQVTDDEFRAVMEREYAARLAQRLGRPAAGPADAFTLPIENEEERQLFESLLQAYRKAEPGSRLAFKALLESALKVSR